VAAPRSLAIDLDRALGDTRGLWDDWLVSAGRLLPVDVAQLPEDRGAAAAALDAAGGNWRALLERFAEERAPVYLRPDAEASAALRRIAATDARIGVFTDAPIELANVALAHLGASRRVTRVEAGTGALDRLRSAFGEGATVVSTLEQLVAADRPAARQDRRAPGADRPAPRVAGRPAADLEGAADPRGVAQRPRLRGARPVPPGPQARVLGGSGVIQVVPPGGVGRPDAASSVARIVPVLSGLPASLPPNANSISPNPG
jgi:hypothetical protein